MFEDQPVEVELTRLPRELLDRLTRRFARFLGIEAAAGAILLLFTVSALLLSNSPWADAFLSAWETQIALQGGSFEFARSLRDWMNNSLMMLFFFLVALEIKREPVQGKLNNPRMAALSIVAALVVHA
jgi:NhaA family Na+:H+ antiporter